MLFADRLGIAALLMSIVGIAITLLWPDKRWVGWLSLSVAGGIALWWGLAEFRPYLTQLGKFWSTAIVFLLSGTMFSFLWIWMLRTEPKVEPKDEHPSDTKADSALQGVPVVFVGYGPTLVPGGVPVQPIDISGMHTTVAATSVASEYRGKDYIVVMMRGTDNTVDVHGDPTMQISSKFHIPEASVEIEVPFSEATAKRLANSLQIELFLAMLPNGVNLSEIRTVDDVNSHNGKFLDARNWKLGKVASVNSSGEAHHITPTASADQTTDK